MRLKKYKGKVYGANWTSNEKKGMNLEIQRQLAEYDRMHEVELDALILWNLHEQLGFGPRRLRKFYIQFTKLLNELTERYAMEDSDKIWLCTHKLKEIGVDVEKWHDEPCTDD